MYTDSHLRFKKLTIVCLNANDGVQVDLFEIEKSSIKII